ncbi:uncharacterized protein LOC132259630 isoform X2 [Phlebotomus argentipes]|uniref:uncharacterized protein LOC132259630 isoform X2 n=1 Tax=Phlebotomus argentipes TaxID=94469 RepID=UPI002892CF66|nr:uncharacterized protein LOC132259630 isoform X2 [Phlebotomus argentipes]
MRGGRGFSRGSFPRGGSSYRGNSSSSYRGGGSGRGGSGSGYNGSGGRYYENNSYSSSHGSRYTDSRSYGGRDHSSGPPFKRTSSHRDFRSPDRKRMRTDNQGMPPPRRSHESYGSSVDRGYSGGSYDKPSHYRGGSGSRAGRHSHASPPPSRGSSFRSGRSDTRGGSTHRQRNDGPMGPPPPRHNRVTGFRGRAPPPSRGGGVIRARGGVALARKRIDMRMKVRSREILQQKLARMRSSLRKRPPTRTSESSTGKKENEEKRIKSEPLNEDDDDESQSKADGSSDAIGKVKSETEAEKDDADATEADVDGEKGADAPKKKNADDDNLPKSRFTGKSFIKLTCVHCCSKFLTFKAYSRHLYGGGHRQSMFRLSRELKEKLTSMRLVQRSEQRDLEKDLTEDEINTRPHYCLLCRLSYRQERTVHQNSDGHKSMRRFLLPYCGTCKLSFKSPMLYETHRCSLEHIKKKARQDAAKNRTENSEDELELENFTTLDSVGSVDEDPDIADPSEIEEPSPDINVGAEHVKKVETLYCELCRVYMSHRDDPERVLSVHCSGRGHLRAYLRFKENKSLRQEAERVHRKHEEEEKKKAAEAEKSSKDDSAEQQKDGEEEEEESVANTTSQSDQKGDDTGDDKMWADVDKDLGDLLSEVIPEEGNEDEDDDEDSHLNSERLTNNSSP